MPTGTLDKSTAASRLGKFHDSMLKGLHEDVGTESPINKLFKKTTRTPEGDVILASIGAGRNPSVQHVDIDGGSVPAGGYRNARTVQFTPGFLFAGVAVTDYVARMSKKFDAKYFDIMADLFEQTKTEIIREQNRIFRSDNKGVVATFDGTPSGTTDLQTDSAKYVVEGKTYDWVNSSGTVLGQVTVSRVGVDGTIDVSDSSIPATAADGDGLAYPDYYTTDFHGFKLLADDGTLAASLGGLAVATAGRHWEGNRDYSAARTVDIEPLIDMALTIEGRTGKACEYALMSPELKKKMALKYTADIRYEPSDTNKLGLGYEGLRIQAGSKPLNVIVDTGQCGPAGWVGDVLMWAPGFVEHWDYLEPTWRDDDLSSSKQSLFANRNLFEYVGQLIMGFQLMTFYRGRGGWVGSYDVTELAKG